MQTNRCAGPLVSSSFTLTIIYYSTCVQFWHTLVVWTKLQKFSDFVRSFFLVPTEMMSNQKNGSSQIIIRIEFCIHTLATGTQSTSIFCKTFSSSAHDVMRLCDTIVHTAHAIQIDIDVCQRLTLHSIATNNI